MYGNVHPEQQVVILWQEITINCYSSSSVRWKKNGKILSKGPDRTISNKLTILYAKYSDAGTYECKGHREDNQVFTAKAEVLVAGSITGYFLNLLYITKSDLDYDSSRILPGSVKKYVGESITLTCQSDGEAIWYYNTQGKPPKTISIFSGDTYSIIIANKKHEGYYFCYGKYEASDELFLARVKVIIIGKICNY